MSFPNAYKGVKKLFIAEILAIISALLVLVSAVLAAVGKNNEPMIAAAGGLLLATGIIFIIVFIIQLVGLHQGGKDEPQIKIAFMLTIFSVLLSLVATILSSINGVAVLGEIARYVRIAVDIATVIALEYTLFGIAHLAKRLGNEKMERFGRTLAWIVCILFVISIVMDLYSGIMNSNVQEWVKTTITIAGIVAGVAEFVVYLLTFIYYGKATKMLKE